MLRLIGDDNEGQDSGKRVEKMAEVELRAGADRDNTRAWASSWTASKNALVHEQKQTEARDMVPHKSLWHHHDAD